MVLCRRSLYICCIVVHLFINRPMYISNFNCLPCYAEINALFNGLCFNYEGKVYAILESLSQTVSFVFPSRVYRWLLYCWAHSFTIFPRLKWWPNMQVFFPKYNLKRGRWAECSYLSWLCHDVAYVVNETFYTDIFI